MPDGNDAPSSLTLREVGARIEELRERHGLTQAHVSARLLEREPPVRLDHSQLSRIERGQRKRFSREPTLARAILECVNAEPAERDEILALLSSDSPRPGPRPALWRRNAGVLGPMKFEGFLALEPKAWRVRNYQPRVVQGLFQTRQYALHVIERMRPDLRPAEVRALVDIRLDRQRRSGETALRDFQALIDEDCLRRTFMDEAVLREQLERLIDESDQPRNTIRILPSVDSIGVHPGVAGGFVLMDFPEPARSVVWLENMVSSGYFDGELYTGRYDAVFTNLWDRALDTEATRVRLKEMIKEL
ncbi:helix-turn-helix domain-containing protein [Streptomyces cellulosae]|uniref:Helix-turn-helix domain-containing protein n=2 Tax=Streptomyces TaxID=1883 RepID=A0ABZ1YFS1_9ACTN|nr:helix-turn-helix domain-containing protein [Streptomyces cellulosae]WTB86568.1 helix-turn-helix domain-containing protein [Streptomyces cellulosae]WTB93377.1 helix-turn-helix domain-containing protein [Streptomyces cellulosae]WTC60769.1 helix-turn-helix domain-containing protein [Streptomyces cellulosae]